GFVKEGNDYRITTSTGTPKRIWRNLEELTAVGKVDFTKKMTWFDRDASLKFGGLYSYKHRDYAINNYEIGSRAINSTLLNGDPNAILLPENIWTPETNSGYYLIGNSQAANMFEAAQHTGALYVSSEFRIGERLRTIVG